MAPLAHTLALLAMAVATAAVGMLPLDMAWQSFDDQYRGCRRTTTVVLPPLIHSEFKKNPLLAQVWVKAEAEWQKQERTVSPLSPEQAIAIMAFTMDGLHKVFNEAVLEAGRSPQEYRDNFHFKSLHFLLTQALWTLRGTSAQCHDVFLEVCGGQFKARRGQRVRIGEFRTMPLDKPTGQCSGMGTLIQVHTCYGAGIQSFTQNPEFKGVLIPPFETFEVSEVTQKGNKTQIQLRSTGTSSKYNCEWLKGGSVHRAPFHFGGLLLATTALAVATGIL